MNRIRDCNHCCCRSMSSHPSSSRTTVRLIFCRGRQSWVGLFLVYYWATATAIRRALSPRMMGARAFAAAFSASPALRRVVVVTQRPMSNYWRSPQPLAHRNFCVPKNAFTTKPTRSSSTSRLLLFGEGRCCRRWITATSMKLFQEEDFIAKQKKISQDATNRTTQMSTSSQPQAPLDNNSNTKSHDNHREHQQRVFDALADTFANGETLSAELNPVYEQLAQHILSHYVSSSSGDPETANNPSTDTTTTTIRILDVACGTGALWPFLVQAVAAAGHRLEVTGVDLSSRMVERAQEHARILLQQQQPNHSFHVVQADILEYQPPSPQEPFDLIIANACFANFWDPGAVLERVAPWLRLDTGTLLVTHPLGSAFVERLHEQDPVTVPRTLPRSRCAWTRLIMTRPWRLLELVDNNVENNSSNSSSELADAPTLSRFYLAALRRVRARALPNVMKLRGAVDTGYGRGGKQLGFPTANLPSRLFQNALQNVTPGVYFGWALLEDNNDDTQPKLGRNVPHKAVVNVGFSPTFEGQENPEKIVEAHLMFDNDTELASSNPLDPPDFYHEVMRLQLIGFLRPEIKFPSFPALIAQIRQDVRDAQVALDNDPYRAFSWDDFLRVPNTNDQDDVAATTNITCWIGSSGGDATASWEIETIELALENVQAI